MRDNTSLPIISGTSNHLRPLSTTWLLHQYKCYQVTNTELQFNCSSAVSPKYTQTLAYDSLEFNYLVQVCNTGSNICPFAIIEKTCRLGHLTTPV